MDYLLIAPACRVTFANLATIVIGAIAAIAPLWAMVIILRQRVEADMDSAREARITDLVRQLEACQVERRRLEDENLRLMKRIFAPDS